MRVNGRRSGGRYVSTDADPKRTFLRDFGSNARSAPPPPKTKKTPKKLAATQPQTVSQANTTLLPYLSHAHARTHARRRRSKSVRACNRDGGERGCWPHTSGTVILAPSAGLFFFNIVLFKSHMCTHTHTHLCDWTGLNWAG